MPHTYQNVSGVSTIHWLALARLFFHDKQSPYQQRRLIFLLIICIGYVLAAALLRMSSSSGTRLNASELKKQLLPEACCSQDRKKINGGVLPQLLMLLLKCGLVTSVQTPLVKAIYMAKPNIYGQEIHSSSREAHHQRPPQLYRPQIVGNSSTIYQIVEFCFSLIEQFSTSIPVLQAAFLLVIIQTQAISKMLWFCHLHPANRWGRQNGEAPLTSKKSGPTRDKESEKQGMLKNAASALGSHLPATNPLWKEEDEFLVIS